MTAIVPANSLSCMRYDPKSLIVYGSPADTVYLLFAPDRGATLISETIDAWTWIGGGVVQIVPRQCYVELTHAQIAELEDNEMYRLGGIPDGDVVYMKVDEFKEVFYQRRQLAAQDRRLLP